tara:strand:- start:112 stop:384 length:273 start_codon:yes stop_codon:yes gene_type:complete
MGTLSLADGTVAVFMKDVAVINAPTQRAYMYATQESGLVVCEPWPLLCEPPKWIAKKGKKVLYCYSSFDANFLLKAKYEISEISHVERLD